MRIPRIFAALLGVAALSAPLTAVAQETPAPPPPPPSYAVPAPAPVPPPPAPPPYARPPANGEETVTGRIDAITGKYTLQVHDDRGFVDNVEMHQGTIINPTGLQLAPGMKVTIMGYNRGRVFAANEIDTPYQSYGFAYPYPYAYPYGFGYPYGFSFGIGFGPVYFHHWR